MRRAASWLATLPLLLSCATTPAPTTPAPPAPPPAPIEPVADRELEARAVLLLLADRRLFDPEALGVFLDGAPAIREALAETLGRIGDPRGRSFLQGLLVDGQAEVRRAAAFALGELGATEARSALLRAAVDPDAETGALAVEALGKLGAPLDEVRRVLAALDGVEGAARLAPHLFRFRESAAVDAARELLLLERRDLRAGAAYALGRLALPEGRTQLRALLGDPEPFVRAWAARGLGEVGEPADLGALLPLALAEAPSPRIQALLAAGKIAGRSGALAPDGWSEAARAGLSAELPGVRAAALQAAGELLPDPELEAALAGVFEAGEPRERELALVALAAGRAAAATERLGRAAASTDPSLRARAAEAAVALRELDLAAGLATDPEPRVRVAALEALAGIAESEAGALAEPFLADRDVTVRATALDQLAAHPTLPFDRLARALAAAGSDREGDARLAAVRALAARGRAVPAERSAIVDLLAERVADPDRTLRSEVIGALEALGEPRPALGALETGRGVAEYREAIVQTRRRPLVDLETSRGTLRLRLECPEAPLTCLSFQQLAAQGYFDAQRFHRVVPDFVVQGGDPRGDGWGGPGYSLRDEINRLRYRRGAVGMALSGPDTGGSQFFIALAPQPHLDGGYTVFATVVGGDEALDAIRQGDEIVAVRPVD
jgi:cyclophilin family peptidyl-prolyl cis-trans isomerase/HEAT repeat protein